MSFGSSSLRPLLAGAVLLALAGPALAEPHMVNNNGSPDVAYDGLPGTEVGGAYARVSGGGTNLTYQAAPDGHTQAGSGLVAVVENVNGKTEVVYLPQDAATGGSRFAAVAGALPAQN